MASSTAPEIPDLHRSAFWIYGVTAMVMREPLGIVLRHASSAGWQDGDVQLEALRSLAVLLLMAKQFLASGIYFDRVYIQAASADRYPCRSYPLDFLFGLGALLVAVGASTVIASPPPVFDLTVSVMLICNLIWLGTARTLRHSTVSRIVPGAVLDLVTLAGFAVILGFFGESPSCGFLVASLVYQMVRLIRHYDAA